MMHLPFRHFSAFIFFDTLLTDPRECRNKHPRRKKTYNLQKWKKNDIKELSQNKHKSYLLTVLAVCWVASHVALHPAVQQRAVSAGPFPSFCGQSAPVAVGKPVLWQLLTPPQLWPVSQSIEKGERKKITGYKSMRRHQNCYHRKNCEGTEDLLRASDGIQRLEDTSLLRRH